MSYTLLETMSPGAKLTATFILNQDSHILLASNLVNIVEYLSLRDLQMIVSESSMYIILRLIHILSMFL